VVAAALDAGATSVSPILLHLRPGVREEFLPWLEDNYPELLPRYRELYPRAYAPPALRKDVGRRVASIVRALGGTRPQTDADSPRFARDRGTDGGGEPSARPTQLTLV